MPDAALLTHPRNRKYADAMKSAAAKLAVEYGFRKLDIGYDRTLAERRVIDGKDDGPLFVLFFGEGQQITMKLRGPGGKAF